MSHDDAISTVGPHPAPVAPVMRWGAIFAGTFVAAGMWLLLHVLGMAVGLSAINPEDMGTLRGVGIGAGIWTLIAPIIALLVGGLATGRLAGPLDRMTGAIHGAIIWTLATVASISLLWTMLSSIVGGAFVAGATVASATASGAMGAVGATNEITPEVLGLTPDELLAPVNQRLKADGMPPITSEQLMTATREALRSSIQAGRMNRQIVVDALARSTALSPAEAADIAGSIQQRYDEWVEAAGHKALEAADAVGKGLLGLTLAMLLGLAAAVAGVVLGARHASKRAALATTSSYRSSMR